MQTRWMAGWDLSLRFHHCTFAKRKGVLEKIQVEMLETISLKLQKICFKVLQVLQ